jgi:hypothetical protein
MQRRHVILPELNARFGRFAEIMHFKVVLVVVVLLLFLSTSTLLIDDSNRAFLENAFSLFLYLWPPQNLKSPYTPKAATYTEHLAPSPQVILQLVPTPHREPNLTEPLHSGRRTAAPARQ